MKFISLTENHLFGKAYRSRQKHLTSTLAVYVLRDYARNRLKKENPQKENINRIGISASKKIGGAVERNRAKRVIREAYRQIDREFGIKRGYIIVFAAREKATVVKMQDVMRDMQIALSKLDMLEKQSVEEKSPVTAEGDGSYPVEGSVNAAPSEKADA